MDSKTKPLDIEKYLKKDMGLDFAGQTDLKQRLNEELKRIKAGSGKAYVFVSKQEQHHFVNNMILEHLTKTMGQKGIYVTLTQEYEIIKKNLKENNISSDKLFFIDGVTKKSSRQADTDYCTFIPGPHALTEMSIAISDATHSGEYDFLFLNSMSVLLMYNELQTIEKFSHALVGKIRKFGLNGILISLDEESSKKLLPLLSQVCDKCINL